jgi:hypothetical protein
MSAEIDNGSSTIGDTFGRVFDSIAEHIPALVVSLLIVLAGWLLARLARRGARQLTGGANRLLERTFRSGSAASVRLSPGFVSVMGELAFWLVLLIAIVLAAGVGGLGSLGEWLNRIVVHLPSLIAGASIIVVGYFLSVYVRELVTFAGRSSQVSGSATMGRLAQGATLTVATIIGLDQAGLDVGMLMILFCIVGGGLVLGLVVAFGIGARDYVGNLIGARNARHVVQPGMRLRIDEDEGEVLELSHTHLVLESAEGRTLLPAHLLESRRIQILAPAVEEPTDG